MHDYINESNLFCSNFEIRAEPFSTFHLARKWSFKFENCWWRTRHRILNFESNLLRDPCQYVHVGSILKHRSSFRFTFEHSDQEHYPPECNESAPHHSKASFVPYLVFPFSISPLYSDATDPVHEWNVDSIECSLIFYQNRVIGDQWPNRGQRSMATDSSNFCQLIGRLRCRQGNAR